MNAVTVKNLKFSYENSRGLCVDDVSFSLAQNSYTAFTGLNGSGKSTIAHLIAGLLESSEGSVEIAPDSTVGIVFQSPKDQIICTVVSRDTEFGPKNLKLPDSEVELRVIESLTATGMLDFYNYKSMSLSLGQTQKIALSGILSLNPDILILDEAISMLDPVSREDILNFLDAFHKKNKTILHITHDAEAVNRADEVLFLQKGKLLWQGKRTDFFEKCPEYSKIIIGEKLINNQKKDLKNHETALIAENLSFCYGQKRILDKVSFCFEKNALISITGPSGSGKSTLFEILSGLLPFEQGKILSCERPVLALQNCDSAFFESFACDDVAFGPKNKGISGKALVASVKNAMDLVSLPFEEFSQRRTFELSGGEKKRLGIAGILALDSNILLFDEPTAGLDAFSRKKVMELMKLLSEHGKTVVFTTHNMEEAAFADKNIVLENAKILSGPLTIKANEALLEQKPIALSSMLEPLREKTVFEKKEKKIPGAINVWAFILFFCASLFAPSLEISAIMLFLSFVYACAVKKVRFSKLFFMCLKLIPLLSIFFVFQMIFIPVFPEEKIFINLRFFKVSLEKLLYCLKILMRTQGAVCFFSGFMKDSSESDLIDAFCFLPKKALVLLEIIFRFLPLLKEEASNIIKTQLIRGGFAQKKGLIAKIKAVIPLVVPLIIQTIRRSERLADALTARGFK